MHGTMEHGERRRPWSILLLLAVAQFMVILDVTVVNVALPSIGSDLGFAPGDLQWVVTTYVLFTGGLLLLGGRAADMLGRRRIFLAGLALFTAASFASGMAASPAMLIASRAAQGLGAAMLSPAALSIVSATYTGAQRTKALSLWGAIAAGGSVVGMVIGGMLTTWLSWQWVFFINLPIGIAAFPLALRLVPARDGTGGMRQLDLAGAVSLVAGLVALVYAIEGTSTHGWGSVRTLAVLAGSGVLLATFFTVEGKARRPLVPPATWRMRTLISGVAMMFGATGFMIGTIYLSSLYMQGELGFTALEAGLAFLPLMITVGVVAQIAGHLLSKLGTRMVMVTGLLLMSAGGGLLATAPDHASYAADLLPGFILVGASLGLVFVSVQITAMSDVGERMAGLASGLFTTGHEIGAAFGVAVFSAVAAGTGGDAVATLSSGSAYGKGIGVAALLAAGLAVIAALAVPSIRPPRAAHAHAH
ncbi:MAG: MFS transporter [Solirubrobacterales bacterium]